MNPIVKAVTTDQPPLRSALSAAYKSPENTNRINNAARAVQQLISLQSNEEDVYNGMSEIQVAELFVYQPIMDALEMRKRLGEPLREHQFFSQVLVFHSLVLYFNAQEQSKV